MIEFWTDARVAVLRGAAAAGLTFTEAATLIGDGCTRNMVAGKAGRMKLSFPATSAKLSRGQVAAIEGVGRDVWRAKMAAARTAAAVRRRAARA